MKYSFSIKDNNQKAYDQFTWFLFFLHIIAAGVIAWNTAENVVQLSLYILLGFYVLIYLVYFYLKKRKGALETFGLIMALLYVNFWFRYVGITSGIIFVIVYLMITVVKGKKTTVHVSAEGVLLTRLFKTVIFPWKEMDNVILKDSLLTIDFRSNKIIQVEVADNTEAVDEESFNSFCAGQLNIKT